MKSVFWGNIGEVFGHIEADAVLGGETEATDFYLFVSTGCFVVFFFFGRYVQFYISTAEGASSSLCVSFETFLLQF